jgi:hypothetical protein
MQTEQNSQDFSIIPGIDDYSPGYYAVTVVGWVIIVAVVGGLAFLVFNLIRNNFTKTTAKAIDATAAVADRIASEVRKSPASQAKSRREEDAFAIAARELEQGDMQKGLWAKAFADADGDEQKQKALYLRYRADQIGRTG